MQEEYKELIQDFVQILKNSFKNDLISVVLFGSVARGTARKESDIDICIVLTNLPQSRYQRHKIISPLLNDLREKPSYNQLFERGVYAGDNYNTLY